MLSTHGVRPLRLSTQRGTSGPGDVVFGVGVTVRSGGFAGASVAADRGRLGTVSGRPVPEIRRTVCQASARAATVPRAMSRLRP